METNLNWTVIQFVSLVFLMAGLTLLATRLAGRVDNEPASTTRRWTIGAMVMLVLWLGIPFVLAKQDLLNDFSKTPPPFLKVMFAWAFLTVILSTVSPWGKRIAKGLSFRALFGFQAFRILVEALLFLFHKAGIAPIQITVEGRNFDVVTGVLGLVVLIFISGQQTSKITYAILNLIGLGLVLNVLTVGMLSLPTSFQVFTGDNTWITRAPFIWLPTFIVPLAVSGHILSFRKLLMEREANPLRKLAEAQ